jgi:hypothetical protein
MEKAKKLIITYFGLVLIIVTAWWLHQSGTSVRLQRAAEPTQINTSLNRTGSSTIEVRAALSEPVSKDPSVSPLSREAVMQRLPSLLNEANADQRFAALRELCLGWALTDLPGVIDWLSSLSIGTDRQDLIRELTLSLADRDLDAALRLATESRLRAGGHVMTHELILRCLAHPSAQTQAWMEALPEDHIFYSNQQRVRLQTQVDPVHAVRWLSQQALSEDDQINLTATVVQELAAQDAHRAAEWVSQFPEGRMREMLLRLLQYESDAARRSLSKSAE